MDVKIFIFMFDQSLFDPEKAILIGLYVSPFFSEMRFVKELPLTR